MIDENGYRYNVGIIIVNKTGDVFWGKRIYQESWQFPQGGIDEGETPHQAAFRELQEEVGLEPKDVRVIGRTKNWLYYNLPKKLIRQDNIPLCIGQRQKWFIFGLEAKDSKINLSWHKKPEFQDWRWVDYWTPVEKIINFKRNVYKRALTELEPEMQKFWLPKTKANT